MKKEIPAHDSKETFLAHDAKNDPEIEIFEKSVGSDKI